MTTIKLRIRFAPLAAIFTAALASFSMAIAVGPISAAHAEDNDVDYAREREEMCDKLQDIYNQMVALASADKPENREFWQNQIEEVYFDAQFDWKCDWAVEGIHRAPGGTVAPNLVGKAPVLQTTGGSRGPSYAVTDARSYRRWLRSKSHRAVCRNLRTGSRRLQDQAQADLTLLVAHFTHCGWAAQLPAAVNPAGAEAPTQSDGTTEPDPSGEATEPQPGDETVVQPPAVNEQPPAAEDSGGSAGSGPLL